MRHGGGILLTLSSSEEEEEEALAAIRASASAMAVKAIAALSHSSTTTSSFINFRTSNTAHHQNLRYLKSLQIQTTNLRSPSAVDQVLATVNFLKSNAFSDSDFPRLAHLAPDLFSPNLDPTDIAPVFHFLAADLAASVHEARAAVLRCPSLLFSDVELCLRPTHRFLTQLGFGDLKSKPHLVNTRVEKLRRKVRFLTEIGMSAEEAARACGRVPAIFGYSLEGNLRPKYEYLVEEMARDLEELKAFPQYFGFSLDTRIAPRHLHLKLRNVRIPLNRMLLWSDNRFYTKWK